MNNYSEMINDIENNKTVTIDDCVFDKKILNDLVKDMSNISSMYPSLECQNFIQLYSLYVNSDFNNKKIDYHKIITAFVIGFGGGVFLAGIFAMIEQFVLRF